MRKLVRSKEKQLWSEGNISMDNQKGERILNDDKVQVWPLNLLKCVILLGAKVTIEGISLALTDLRWLQKHEEGAI